MNILVTGGGTIAPIDDVRQVSNLSTGRFSSAISEAALRRGHEVWHLHAPGAIVPFAERSRYNLEADPASEFARLAALKVEWDGHDDRFHLVSMRRGTVSEYAEMLRATLLARPIDAIILAMAVSDYAPEPESGKLGSGLESRTLRLQRLPKVIDSVREWAPEAYLVGFKLLSGSTEAYLIERAARAAVVTRSDLTVANDLGLLKAGRHTIHLVRPGHRTETVGPGADLAGTLIDRVATWSVEQRITAAAEPDR